MTVIGVAVVIGVGLLARRVGGWWVGVVGRRARRDLSEPVDERQPRDVGGAGGAAWWSSPCGWRSTWPTATRPPAVGAGRLLRCRDRTGGAGAQRARPPRPVAGDRRVAGAARRRRRASGLRTVALLCCATAVVLAPWVGRQPGAVRASRAAHHERWHDPARCQLPRRLLRFRTSAGGRCSVSSRRGRPSARILASAQHAIDAWRSPTPVTTCNGSH